MDKQVLSRAELQEVVNQPCLVMGLAVQYFPNAIYSGQWYGTQKLTFMFNHLGQMIHSVKALDETGMTFEVEAQDMIDRRTPALVDEREYEEELVYE